MFSKKKIDSEIIDTQKCMILKSWVFSYTEHKKKCVRKPPPNNENIGYGVKNRTTQVTGEAHKENSTCVSNPVTASTRGWLCPPQQCRQPAQPQPVQRQPDSSKTALQEEPFQCWTNSKVSSHLLQKTEFSSWLSTQHWLHDKLLLGKKLFTL